MPYLNIHGWHEFRWDRLTHEILFVHSSVHLFYSINAWMNINTASNKHALWFLSCQFFFCFFFCWTSNNFKFPNTHTIVIIRNQVTQNDMSDYIWLILEKLKRFFYILTQMLNNLRFRIVSTAKSRSKIAILITFTKI